MRFPRRLVPALLFVTPLCADVTLPALFSDHAVLLKADKVPVWGKASPGEAVTVTLGKTKASATAGADGRWRVALDLRDQPSAPQELVAQGKNRVVINDVVVGEVWLCAGQSNMAFPLSAFPIAKEEVPASTNPQLRHFLVKQNASPVPVEDAEGKWLVADPKTSGQFSAVGYFFGKNLQRELKVPVGLINNSIGGTFIETWMSKEAFAGDPALEADATRAQNERKAFDDYVASYKTWQKQFNREDKRGADAQTFAAKSIDTSDWKKVTLPGKLSVAGLPDAGAIWLRRIVNVPSDDVTPGKGIDLYLGDLRDFAEVYWNGRRIATSDLTDVTHRHGVRGNLVEAGENVLAVRLFNAVKDIGILESKMRFQGNHHMLKGEWLAKVETALPALDAAAEKAFVARPTAVPYDPQNVASYLFNGMVAPVIPYGLRGIVWYQGEGNWNRGYLYRSEFPLLIKDWRAKWGRGDLPFYFCQVANLSAPSNRPGNADQAELREAQGMALSLPNTGQAILIDVGEEGNIHPANKMAVGDRLARIAFANTYGRKDVVFSGPVFAGSVIEGSKIRVKFTHVEGGLVARPLPATYQPLSDQPKTLPLVRNSPDGEIEGLAICGADGKWQWATGKIEGSDVIVWNDSVTAPLYVRYAWASNPTCNLYNGAGLPAGPFRTDDFPTLSSKRRY